VKEAYEEAGIAGNVSNRPLGLFTYEKWNGICRVQVFSLFVTNILDKWPEDTFRFRQWFDFSEVTELVENDELRKLMLGFIRNHQNILV